VCLLRTTLIYVCVLLCGDEGDNYDKRTNVFAIFLLLIFHCEFRPAANFILCA
jgi:hypothetical protein